MMLSWNPDTKSWKAIKTEETERETQKLNWEQTGMTQRTKAGTPMRHEERQTGGETLTTWQLKQGNTLRPSPHTRVFSETGI